MKKAAGHKRPAAFTFSVLQRNDAPGLAGGMTVMLDFCSNTLPAPIAIGAARRIGMTAIGTLS